MTASPGKGHGTVRHGDRIGSASYPLYSQWSSRDGSRMEDGPDPVSWTIAPRSGTLRLVWRLR